jgi:pantetheine-phosphate adenylyltransferase
MMPAKKKVVVGGTFAFLHEGHRCLLRRAFSIGDYVLIGLTTDAYVGKRKAYSQSYAIRRRALRDFVSKFGKRYSIVPLRNRYGPTLSADFDAIVVSKETKLVAERINLMRRRRGRRAMRIVVVPYVRAYDGKPISSRRIARAEIDGHGKSGMAANIGITRKKHHG